MAIHTFGEYLGFHPHLHALVADGLFRRGGWFLVLPDSGIRPLEELFPGDPFPDYPVTTLSRGTGLTWQHGSGYLSAIALAKEDDYDLCANS